MANTRREYWRYQGLLRRQFDVSRMKYDGDDEDGYVEDATLRVTLWKYTAPLSWRLNVTGHNRHMRQVGVQVVSSHAGVNKMVGQSRRHGNSMLAMAAI